jgi:hypothetical protein
MRSPSPVPPAPPVPPPVFVASPPSERSPSPVPRAPPVAPPIFVESSSSEGVHSETASEAKAREEKKGQTSSGQDRDYEAAAFWEGWERRMLVEEEGRSWKKLRLAADASARTVKGDDWRETTSERSRYDEAAQAFYDDELDEELNWYDIEKYREELQERGSVAEAAARAEQARIPLAEDQASREVTVHRPAYYYLNGARAAAAAAADGAPEPPPQANDEDKERMTAQAPKRRQRDEK